ncbi:intradiol ring-cleavage dioxygenase [uncultured Pontibacter sp.]|uniref:dioxygenase family protein n=1 Tax=uncultured Pontibacter sp. TaxID=453356 RepID=UPI002638733C|nr:intradiol ring-cleavage dioxygenase [uncultured Pontibacter sp.]
MKNALGLYFKIAILLAASSCNGQTQPDSGIKNQTNARVGGPCDTCELMYVGMPQSIDATDTSKAWSGDGDKLVLTGTVYRSDQKTPAPDILLYYWQTNEDGLYADKQGLNPDVKRHGYIRGWVKTDRQGKYTIYTIRPAPYPNNTMPAHVHMLVKEPTLANEYYIDDVVFEDDPLLTSQERNQFNNIGGSSIVKPRLLHDVQYVNRDIILGLNVKDYPEQ